MLCLDSRRNKKMSTLCSHSEQAISAIKPSVSVRRYTGVTCPHFRIAVALIHNDNVIVYTFGDAVVVAEECKTIATNETNALRISVSSEKVICEISNIDR